MRRERMRGVAAAGGALVLAWVVAAPSAMGARGTPSPARALQEAARAFVKARSYHVELDVVGGYADDGTHAVKSAVVREGYAGDVYAGIMHLPEVRAYRTMKRGAAFVDGAWRNILSDRSTVKVDRLFRFPEEILANAIRHARRSGTWVREDEPGEEGAGPARAGTESEGSGRTAVGGRSGDAKADAPAPRIVRVEAPPQEALEHILRVQNSNCFGVG